MKEQKNESQKTQLTFVPISSRFKVSPDRDPEVYMAYTHWENSLFFLASSHGTMGGSYFQNVLSQSAALEVKFSCIVLSLKPTARVRHQYTE
jgi:hypothetical protein